MGTDMFPEDSFAVQDFILDTFKNRGHFADVIIDGSMPAEQSVFRKPRTGRMEKYLRDPIVDIARSFVIGDRITDVQFAKNMGCKALFLNPGNLRGQTEITDTIEYLKENNVALSSTDWKDVYEFLKHQ
ncbi:MAG: HAD hydrolase-like protein [Ferruginibacter sp.]